MRGCWPQYRNSSTPKTVYWEPVSVRRGGLAFKGFRVSQFDKILEDKPGWSDLSWEEMRDNQEPEEYQGWSYVDRRDLSNVAHRYCCWYWATYKDREWRLRPGGLRVKVEAWRAQIDLPGTGQGGHFCWAEAWKTGESLLVKNDKIPHAAVTIPHSTGLNTSVKLKNKTKVHMQNATFFKLLWRIIHLGQYFLVLGLHSIIKCHLW